MWVHCRVCSCGVHTPQANVNIALGELHNCISLLQNKHSVFKRGQLVYLEDSLPAFASMSPWQLGMKIHKASLHSHGTFQNCFLLPPQFLKSLFSFSVFLIPAYMPVDAERRNTAKKSITVWPVDALAILQDCFQDTDCNMFREATNGDDVDMERGHCTSSALNFVNKCMDDFIITWPICQGSKEVLSTRQAGWSGIDMRAGATGDPG